MKLIKLSEAIKITGHRTVNALYQTLTHDERIQMRWEEGRRVVDEDELRHWQETMRRKPGRPADKEINTDVQNAEG